MSAAYSLDGAMCEGVATADYDPFFPDSDDLAADALALCSICPVRQACLAYAVDTSQVFGIWGGTTQQELRHLVAQAGGPRARRVPTDHGNAGKTHCKHGHPYDAANTYYTVDGERRCRACRRARLTRARGLASPSGGER